nr:MAG TPA: protein of unknown function (DUF5531) [Caudoviricetes sp.]
MNYHVFIFSERKLQIQEQMFCVYNVQSLCII